MNLHTLSMTAGTSLKQHGLTVSFAESCTGGLVGHLITEIPGSSEWFLGSAVVYSNEAKQAVLNVPKEIVSHYGAVSSQTAKHMAMGALRIYHSSIAVAITGIAGPTGGTADKPVGTVYFHLAGADGTHRSFHIVWSGDRSSIKKQSAEKVLHMILAYTQSYPHTA